jgi:hypothetical protein
LLQLPQLSAKLIDVVLGRDLLAEDLGQRSGRVLRLLRIEPRSSSLRAKASMSNGTAPMALVCGFPPLASSRPDDSAHSAALAPCRSASGASARPRLAFADGELEAAPAAAIPPVRRASA